MMGSLLGALVTGFLKLLAVAGVSVYTALVFKSYRSEGPHSSVRWERSAPARSAERLGVWLGVEALDISLRAARGVYNTLVEASAEVGEWYIRHRSPEVQASVRSRFKV